MLNGDGQTEGGVALLVDFENLALGAEGGREVDCGALLTLAAGFGPVCGANVYADWRMKTLRRYPEDFYGLPMEFVQVLGRYRGRVLKNAVDVRMAVDAVELMHAMPAIDVYVVVTGDRDFIHVVQALQQRGKTVVGVAPCGAASAELVALCDRFVFYESIAGRAGPRPEPKAADARGRLRALVGGGGGAKRAVRRILGFRGGMPGGPERDASARSPRGANGTDPGKPPTAGAAGGLRGLGWGWFRWAREQLESGAVAVNADGGWLHRIGDEAFAVVPDCFEEWAAREGVGAKTAKNRVGRLRRHRSQRRAGGTCDRFHAALGDGRKARGMLFPGELLWGDDEPDAGSATLV